MNKKSIAAFSASALLCTSQLAFAYLPGSVSGPFYNPEQSGHGITVTIANDQMAIAIWHVFTTDGKPLTLYIEGEVEGRSIVGDAYAPNGMRFGDFNPADVELPHWGDITISFDSCDHATLNWDADDPSYPDGEMPIRRLVQPVGVDCALPVENDIAPGLYESRGDEGSPLQGLVDDEGVLWGIERSYRSDGAPFGQIPSPGWIGVFAPFSVVATPVEKSDPAPRTLFLPEGTTYIGLSTSWSPLWWLYQPERRDVWSSSGQNVFSTKAGAPAFTLSNHPFYSHFHLEAGSTISTQLTSLSLPDLSGHYRVPTALQFAQSAAGLEISPSGTVCIRTLVDDAACRLTGTISVANSELGIVEFRLSHPDNPSLPTYFGRGWMADADYGRELVLVGHPDGGKGFGLIAVKNP